MTSTGKTSEFAAALERERTRVDGRLAELLGELARGPEVVEEAVRYAVLGGGKRLRPILCLWTHDALGGSAGDACLDTACAIECLHTYSLVHDDLPCMDDDDLRRGRPSCHKQYGEAVAVLTGDALLTVCFEILSSLPDRRGVPSDRANEAVRLVARAAGTGGLIGGQILDISSPAAGGGIEHVNRIHAMKTAALIAASMECGALMSGASRAERAKIREAGEWAGQAFQIIDDVLDVEADPASLGKTPGKDARAGKLTYASLSGTTASRARAADLSARARGVFEGNPAARGLCALFEFMIERRR
jgi:geranylgeranyl diphosphate synthase type II